MRNFILAVGAVIALIGCHSAYAGTATATAAVSVVAAPLKVVITGLAVDASWPAGTVVMTMAGVGGNGKAIIYTFSGTPPADLAISGNTVVVGPNGVAPGNGGTIENISILATQ